MTPPIKIILFNRVRKFRDKFYHYTLFRQNGQFNISIEERKDGRLLFESRITDTRYSLETCLNFMTILANTLTFPEQLQELYEDNDLDDLS